jgi:hypothetical protein
MEKERRKEGREGRRKEEKRREGRRQEGKEGRRKEERKKGGREKEGRKEGTTQRKKGRNSQRKTNWVKSKKKKKLIFLSASLCFVKLVLLVPVVVGTALEDELYFYLGYGQGLGGGQLTSVVDTLLCNSLRKVLCWQSCFLFFGV